MNFVFRTAARGAQRTGHQISPVVDVMLGITDDGRLSGGAGRGVNTHHLLHRYGKGIERIVITQVLLGGARKLTDVFQRFKIVRVNARGVKLAFVHRNVVIGVMQRPFQTLGLQRL